MHAIYLLLSLRPEYSGWTKSTSWLLTTWLLAQPWRRCSLVRELIDGMSDTRWRQAWSIYCLVTAADCHAPKEHIRPPGNILLSHFVLSFLSEKCTWQFLQRNFSLFFLYLNIFVVTMRSKHTMLLTAHKPLNSKSRVKSFQRHVLKWWQGHGSYCSQQVWCVAHELKIFD